MKQRRREPGENKEEGIGLEKRMEREKNILFDFIFKGGKENRNYMNKGTGRYGRKGKRDF